MSLTNPLPRATRQSPVYVADGVSAAYPFAFYFLDVADLAITVKIGDAPAQFFAEGVGYTATGARAPGGGVVTLDVVPPAGALVQVTGRRIASRLTNVVTNGVVRAAPLEAELDAVTMTLQELRRDVATQLGSEGVLDERLKADLAAAAAAASAAEAATQAGVATTQAGIATTEAGIATAQAGVAATQTALAITASNRAGIVSRGSWASLATITGSYLGQRAEVIGDGGQHTDPVTGVTLRPNSGLFDWTVAPPGWTYRAPAPVIGELRLGVASDSPIIYDERNALGGGAYTVYIRNKVTYGTANARALIEDPRSSPYLTGYVAFSIPTTVAQIVIYLDLGDLAAPLKSVLAPLNVPDGCILIGFFWYNGWSTSWSVETIEHINQDRVLGLREPIVVEHEKILIPRHYVWNADGTTLVEPADGSRFFEHAIGANSSASLRIIYDRSQSGDARVREVTGGTAPIVPNIRFAVYAWTLGRTVSSEFDLVGTSGRPASRNQFYAGKTPDKAAYLYPNAVVVDADAELVAAGFPRAVSNSVDGWCFYGGDIDEAIDLGDFIGVRCWIWTPSADNWGLTPQCYLRPSETSQQGASAGGMTLEKKISDHLAIFSYFNPLFITPAAQQKYVGFHVGAQNGTAGAIQVAGVQFCCGRTAQRWMHRWDFPDADLLSETPIYATNLWCIAGEPFTLYPSNLVSNRFPRRGKIAAYFSSVKDSVKAYSVGGDGPFEIDPDRCGTSGRLIVRSPDDAGEYRREIDLAIRKASPGAGSMTIWCIGDSIWNNGLTKSMSDKLVALGRTPNFVGTVFSSAGESAGVAGNADGVRGEARGGMSCQQAAYMVTTRAPVPIGGEAAYLAADKATQLTYAPWLRAATGGDPPERVFNGYIIDFATYRARFGVPAVTDIFCGLGVNDMLVDPDGKTDLELQSLITSFYNALISSVREDPGCASAKMHFSMPTQSRRTGDWRWEHRVSNFVRAMIAYLRGRGDPLIFVVPLWAHIDPEAFTAMDHTVDVDAWGTSYGPLGDITHPTGVARVQQAYLLAAAAAY